jgi:hypothetical protein
MVTHMVALGLYTWHAVWTPVKAWAENHQDHNGSALQFFASATTIIGLPILALLIVVTLVFLIRDRVETKRLRALQRRAILLGLRTELMGTRRTADQDMTAFVHDAGGVWTILPHTSIEQALFEAGSLGLTGEQIVGLHELRRVILRANSLVSAKLAAPGSVSGNRTAHSGTERDRFSREIRDQCEKITGLCDNLLAHLHVA